MKIYDLKALLYEAIKEHIESPSTHTKCIKYKSNIFESIIKNVLLTFPITDESKQITFKSKYEELFQKNIFLNKLNLFFKQPINKKVEIVSSFEIEDGDFSKECNLSLDPDNRYFIYITFYPLSILQINKFSKFVLSSGESRNVLEYNQSRKKISIGNKSINVYIGLIVVQNKSK